MSDSIAVIGAGSWGTSIANHLYKKGLNPTLYTFEKEVISDVNQNRINSKYLDGKSLANFETQHISDYKTENIIINAIPTKFIRSFYEEFDINIDSKVVINCSKGIERGTNYRISEIFINYFKLPINNYCVLTGPSHAEEVIETKPTVVVAGSENESLAKKVQEIFSNEYFRVYTSNDLIGCELGGSLKNVIALASGITSGLSMGDNVGAALLTRGLAEIIRLGEAMGGEALTFAGLSGLGDLFVTCASELSRNRKVGRLIANGMTVEEIEGEYSFIAEGINTAQSALELSKKLNIEMPIVNQVNQILFDKKDPSEAVKDLMLRDYRNEFS